MILLIMWMFPLLPHAFSQEMQARSDDRRLHRVSLIRVIANPAEYDGKHIRVVGYLQGTGLDSAVGVYVSEVDGRNGILSNAISITVGDTTTKGMIGKYVIVSGLYHAPPPQGDFNGYIDHILEVKPLKMGDAPK
jgi:hypothetical protein